MEGAGRRPEINIGDFKIPEKKNPENPDGKGIEVGSTRTIEGLDDTSSANTGVPHSSENEEEAVSVETNPTFLLQIYRFFFRSK